MSRGALRQETDPSTNENILDESDGGLKDLIKVKQVNRQDSFESNFEVSTRCDGSFEYSDYDDHSFNRSQSYMDETHGPALLAFVEDYILGKRLEILDTCETEDDAASSSSSSFGSETCFSQEESRMYKHIKTLNSGSAPKNTESGSTEAPKATDTVNDTITTKKSRWESLLHSLSAVKRKDSINNQTNSDIISIKKENVLMSRPKFLAAIKAKRSSTERATIINEVDETTDPLDSLHHLKNLSTEKSNCDLFEKSSEIRQYTNIEVEKKALMNTGNKSIELADNAANDGHAETNHEQLLTFEITDTEHINRVLTGGDQQDMIINVADQSEEAKTVTPKQIPSEILNVIEESEINTSVHSEGVEIPNIPQFTIGSSSPIKSRTDSSKYFLRGRVPRNERFVAICPGVCDRNKSEVVQVIQCKDDRIESTSLTKPILCSRCRGALTDNSVCALLSNESFINLADTTIPEIEVKKDIAFLIDLATVHAASSLGQIQEEQYDMSWPNVDNVEEKNDAIAVDHDTQNLNEEAVLEILGPTNATDFCCEVSGHTLEQATSTILPDSAHKEESNDSPVANIETTITAGSPSRKSTTPTVQIEFKDWAGKDVEIIKESPRKNRLLWMQGVMSNNKIPPIEMKSISALVNDTDEKNDREDLLTSKEQFPSSASVCNFEITSCGSEKKLSKLRYFGRERTILDPEGKSVLISPVNILPTSVSEDVDDAISQGNTECCLESSAASLTSRVLHKDNPCVGQKTTASEVKSSIQSNRVIHDTEEAFILERAMQQVHTEGKFATGNSKTRSHITSPVTLYRFLDFNPCRNELVQDNSYDFVYDPIGLAVCQVPKVDLQANFASRRKNSEQGKLPDIVSNAAQHIHHKPGSSLKKVLRRLSKPNKVAFRENLVDVYSKDSEAKPSTPKIMESTDTNLLKYDKSKGGPINTSDPTKNGSKIAANDKLKALLTEKSKGKRVNELVRYSSSKSLGSATKVLAAIKAEYKKRRMRNHTASMPINNTNEKQKRNEAPSKLRQANAAMILQEFKKAHAEGKLDRGNEPEIPTQEGSDGTIVTSGTKQSQISSVSRLTVEEKKLAHRLLNDIQLLAMIEKKRQSMGQLQSSLKSADIDRSVQLLKSIEASRKNRISQDCDSEAPSTTKQQEMVAPDELVSVVGKVPTLSDITSTKKINK
jgi:hypothetical protein